MRLNWSRRALLASIGMIGISGLTGCSSSKSSRGATDIILHNGATNRRTIDVTVRTRSDDSTEIDTSVELESNARHTINNKVLMGNNYDVEVTFTDEADGSSPYTETQEWNNAGKPLHIIVREQIVFAVQVG